jgi:hypothetical protein
VVVVNAERGARGSGVETAMRYLFPPVAIAWVTAVVIAAGCGGKAKSSGTVGDRSASPVPSPSASVLSRPLFKFTIPLGWQVSPPLQPRTAWALGVPPHKNDPAFETINSEQSDPWITIGARPVAAGVSLAQWVKQMRATRTVIFKPDECVPVEHETTSSLGPEPAISLAFHCPVDGPKALGVTLLALHAGSGFVAFCYSEQGRTGTIPQAEAFCTRTMGSLVFTG